MASAGYRGVTLRTSFFFITSPFAVMRGTVEACASVLSSFFEFSCFDKATVAMRKSEKRPQRNLIEASS
jgi:hypothetical protein